MIIIHGYRATTLVLYILLNVLVRTGEYNQAFRILPFSRRRLFFRGLFARARARVSPSAESKRIPVSDGDRLRALQ